MTLSGIRSIRGRTTLVSVIASACAMVLVVVVTALAVRAFVTETIANALSDRLDAAELLVKEGDLQRAVDSSGVEILQVVDADGNVIAASEKARGLQAIGMMIDSDRFELDDFEVEKDDDGDEGGDGYGQTESSSAAPADTTQQDPPQIASTPLSSDGDVGDADDQSGDDHDDGIQDSPEPDGDESDYASESDSDDEARLGAGGGNGGYEADDDGDNAREAAFSLEDVMGTETAYAAGTKTSPASDAQSIEASEVMGTPGPFLVLKRTVFTEQGLVTLVAMTSLAPAIDAARHTAAVLVAILTALLGAVGIFTYQMTGRTLQPVDAMRQDVDAISAHDLTRRIEAPSSDEDLQQLAHTFNTMLDRVERSFAEQQRFVSDASHELKSPVAATRLILETIRDHPDQVVAPEVIADLSAENERMASIVEDLLALARQDEGRMQVRKVPVDLYDLLLEEVSAIRSRTAATVNIADMAPVVCDIDPSLLSHAVRNLLENAARYAETTIKVSCAEKGADIEILVSDDGPGIPEADHRQVFDRFVRLEEDRNRQEGSTGLGLSVVKGIVSQHGGSVCFTAPELGGATALITLPK
jgi:signal transduction histidine kinase